MSKQVVFKAFGKVLEWFGPRKDLADLDTEKFGWANESVAPHLFIDIPDGYSTLSTLTSEGKKICICFLPYEEGGAPQCVDILRRDAGGGLMDLGREDYVPTHDVKVMSGGWDLLDTRGGDEMPTVTCILLTDREDKS
jgi:hypothetical protein